MDNAQPGITDLLDPLARTARTRRMGLALAMLAAPWFHGGGYTIGSAHGYREMAARISAACGRRVLLPDYRLAPEHPFPAAIEDAVTAARSVIGRFGAAATAIGGDSAGAGLTFAALPALRDAGDPLPHRAVVFSPLVELTGAGTSLEANAATDAAISPASLQLIQRIYLRDIDPLDPRASPVGADLQALPPTLILVSTTEVLLDGALTLAARIDECGGDARVRLHDGMVHAWPLFPFLHESDEAAREVAEFIDSDIG